MLPSFRLLPLSGRSLLTGVGLIAVVVVAGVVLIWNSPSGGLPGSGSREADLLKDIGVKLAGVVALIYGFAWLLRRLSAGRPNAAAGWPRLELLDTLALGPQRAVHLIRAGGRTFIVGATPSQLTRLGELAEGDGDWVEVPGSGQETDA